MIRVLLFLLVPALASAQTVTPSGSLAWEHVATVTETSNSTPTRFELSIDGTWVNIGLPPKLGDTYTHPLPAAPAGPHTFMVRACNTAGCSAASNPVSATYDAPPPPPPVCDASNSPSVFVTRWEHTTGRPGSRMRINYQLASPSPIVEIQARIGSLTVATVTGTDLRDSGGIWLTTPAVGSYPMSIWAKNSTGCTREAASLVPLVVK